MDLWGLNEVINIYIYINEVIYIYIDDPIRSGSLENPDWCMVRESFLN